jgi:flagellar basal body-associated protein FliL
MTPQLAVYFLIALIAIAVILWIVFSAHGRAIQAQASADVDELHAKVDAIHTRITNLISEVRGTKVVAPATPAASASQGPQP